MVNCGKTKQPSPKQLYEYMDKVHGKNVNSSWLNVKLIYPNDNVMTTQDSDTESNDTIVVPDANEIFVEEQ